MVLVDRVVMIFEEWVVDDDGRKDSSCNDADGCQSVVVLVLVLVLVLPLVLPPAGPFLHLCASFV
jgi:hypothetical protein